MKENVSLIKEINDLRRELKISRTQIHDLEAALGLHSKNNKSETATLAAITAKTPSVMMEKDLEERQKIIEMQRLELKRLRSTVEQLEHYGGSRPSSGTKLQPIESF